MLFNTVDYWQFFPFLTTVHLALPQPWTTELYLDFLRASYRYNSPARAGYADGNLVREEIHLNDKGGHVFWVRLAEDIAADLHVDGCAGLGARQNPAAQKICSKLMLKQNK